MLTEVQTAVDMAQTTIRLKPESIMYTLFATQSTAIAYTECDNPTPQQQKIEFTMLRTRSTSVWLGG